MCRWYAAFVDLVTPRQDKEWLMMKMYAGKQLIIDPKSKKLATLRVSAVCVCVRVVVVLCGGCVQH